MCCCTSQHPPPPNWATAATLLPPPQLLMEHTTLLVVGPGEDEDGPVVGVGEVDVGLASVVVEGSSRIVTVVL